MHILVTCRERKDVCGTILHPLPPVFQCLKKACRHGSKPRARRAFPTRPLNAARRSFRKQPTEGGCMSCRSYMKPATEQAKSKATIVRQSSTAAGYLIPHIQNLLYCRNPNMWNQYSDTYLPRLWYPHNQSTPSSSFHLLADARKEKSKKGQGRNLIIKWKSLRIKSVLEQINIIRTRISNINKKF